MPCLLVITPCPFVKQNASASNSMKTLNPIAKFERTSAVWKTGWYWELHNFLPMSLSELLTYLSSRDLCHESWTNLRRSPMFSCICPNNNMKKRCDRIFSMVNHNPCVGKFKNSMDVRRLFSV